MPSLPSTFFLLVTSPDDIYRIVKEVHWDSVADRGTHAPLRIGFEAHKGPVSCVRAVRYRGIVNLSKRSPKEQQYAMELKQKSQFGFWISTGFAFRFEHRKWNRGRNGLHQSRIF